MTGRQLRTALNNVLTLSQCFGLSIICLNSSARRYKSDKDKFTAISFGRTSAKLKSIPFESSIEDTSENPENCQVSAAFIIYRYFTVSRKKYLCLRCSTVYCNQIIILMPYLNLSFKKNYRKSKYPLVSLPLAHSLDKMDLARNQGTGNKRRVCGRLLSGWFDLSE